jgi:hypothetical protein
VFAVVLLALWLITLTATGLGELSRLTGPHLQLYPHSTPTPEAALTIWLNNLRVTGWPLLALALRMHRTRWRRRLANICIAGSLAANAALVGAAIAAGGERILPYLPHLPLEWAALALSATAWLLGSRNNLRRRQLVVIAGALAALLGAGALLETYAVPHL